MTDFERRSDRHVPPARRDADPVSPTVLFMPMADADEERAWDEAAERINARRH